MVVDYHLHSCFSEDSTEEMEKNIQAAIKKGISEIALTDHYDMDYPSDTMSFTLDLDRYLERARELKERYRDEIEIRIGIELGLQPHLKTNELINEILDSREFDFIIGSTHCVDRREFEEGDFFRGFSKDEAHRRYFQGVLENIKIFENYSVAGHLDFIRRYGRDYYEDYRVIDYEKHSEIIDEILRTLIEKGIGLEVNTSGLRYGLGDTTPGEFILRRYRELGGEILTLGSDAHEAAHVGSNIEEAVELLRGYGFKTYCTFKNREKKFISF